MGRQGYAITFVRPEEGELLTGVEKLINKQLTRLEEPWIVRENLPPPVEQVPVEEPPGGLYIPKRFKEALRRCEILEAHGLRPLKRTLGSRFRSTRRKR
jgi:superfamily II DNA/RNA helicase